MTPGTRTIMRTVKRMKLMLAVALLAGCGTPSRHDRIAILTAKPKALLGGEARFVGELEVRDGCLVAKTGTKVATPIFDAGIVLQPDASAIIDRRLNVRVPLGRTFQAGSAWMRDGDHGWAIDEIEEFFGAHVPDGCPRTDIVRLHDFEVDPPVVPGR